MKNRSYLTLEQSARKPGRLGFTLIELLVVIAIIAILAAILFPVFSRAKAASKTSVSLSNTKQQSLAVIGYANDYDDNFVLAGQWHSQDPDATNRFPSSWYMPWTGLVEPYTKNQDILISPFRSVTTPFTDGSNYCNSARQCKLLYPTYGYNACYLSPSDRTTGVNGSLSTTAVAKPSEQVMLTEIWHRGTTQWRGFAVGQDFAYINLGTAEAPDGATGYGSARTKPWGNSSWGNYQDGGMKSLGMTDEEGLDTGGVAFRCPGFRTPVAFADGHVKAMTDTQLAVGTDWVRGQTFVAKNLVNGKYLWDPRGD